MVPKMMGGRGGGMGGNMGRPGPYDRMDRGYGGGMSMGNMGGGGGGMGYGRGRGRGNIKGFYDDNYEDFGGGYGGNGMGGMGRMGGSQGGMRRGGAMGGGGMGGRAGMGGGGGMGRGGGRFGQSGGKGGMDNYESSTGHSVHMRGLPFQAAEDDIVEFFKPLTPVNITIHYMADGKASGQADVDFATHQEATDAMSRDRESMEHRYIELFLKSSEGYKGPGGRGGFDHNSFGSGNTAGMGGTGRGNFNVNNMGTNYTAF
eukprot:GHVO01047048.1.p1 GENE.GHVO01047048.1~~GHVO01047048.1.p1  ORF type:complete len:259 (-),score=26.31 GHVO01047048.1:300-1076(-)